MTSRGFVVLDFSGLTLAFIVCSLDIKSHRDMAKLAEVKKLLKDLRRNQRDIILRLEVRT